MKTTQAKKIGKKAFQFTSDSTGFKAPLVLVFGNRFMLEDPGIFEEVKQHFPTGHIVFGTTSGEIMNEHVSENSVVLTAIDFEKGSFEVKRKNVTDFDHNDHDLGDYLMSEFSTKNLIHLFLVS